MSTIIVYGWLFDNTKKYIIIVLFVYNLIFGNI